MSSSAGPGRIEAFDPALLERDEVSESEWLPGGSLYALVWGRDVSQANVEAFVKSSQIWAAGVQELTKVFAATTKVSFDESVSTFKAIAAAKSVTEALDLQSAFANGVVAKTLAESNKLIDASIKLTEQTLAPISARVTGAVETFSKAA